MTLAVELLHRPLHFGADPLHRSLKLVVDALHLFVQATAELFHRPSELASERFEWMFRHDSPRLLYCIHNTAARQRREGRDAGRKKERLHGAARSSLAPVRKLR